ncbi:MAG: mechanosensitive ion channel family protein [Euryarchaeota archaeon]|nr:mechanosensitive ion channel family protein [Euryarchaeota archaeon]
MQPHERRGNPLATAPFLLLLVLAAGLSLASPALGQDADEGPVALTPVDTEAKIAPGETALLVWKATVLPGANRTLLADVGSNADAGWTLSVDPEVVRLAPGESIDFTVSAQADDRPAPRDLRITLRLITVDADDPEAESERLVAGGTVTVHGTRLVLGQWDNPLPPPLDDAWGVFLLNLAAWVVIALLVMLAIDPTLRLLTKRTKTEMDDHIIHILRFPVFLVLATWGLKQSLEVFDLPVGLFSALDRLWVVVLILAGFYVAYRVWQEIIVHIGKRMAAKTESKVDDRLIPVMEKAGGVVILIVGFFFLIDNLGFDMTIFAAGGVLGGMVIAFAAQDTLSNFFSGVHILTDQPFVEGDDILLDTGEVCTVTKIGLRTTELYHLANHEVILIPNNHLAQNRIINLLRPDKLYKVRIDVGVAYGSDVPLVKKTLLEIAKDHPLTLKDDDHQPFVRFQSFGASSLDFSVHAWVGDVYSRWLVASDLREMVDQRFRDLAIEIPFPQQVNWDGAKEAAKLEAARQISQREGHEGRETVPPKSPSEARHEVGSTGETGGSGDGEGESV